MADVAVPEHVRLGADRIVRCGGCGDSRDLTSLERSDAERQLGEFCRHHRRHAAREPSAVALMIARAKVAGAKVPRT